MNKTTDTIAEGAIVVVVIMLFPFIAAFWLIGKLAQIVRKAVFKEENP